MILVAVDPGNVTGVAAWWDPEVYDSTERGSSIDFAEVERSTLVTSVIRRMLDGQRPNKIGIERFHEDPRKTRQPAAREVIGAVSALAEEYGIRCVFQTPGAAKKIASTTVLKRVGWWHPTPDGHQNMAIRHIILLMATYYPTKFAELVGL